MPHRETVRQFVANALAVAGLGSSHAHKQYSLRRVDEGAEKYGETRFRDRDPAKEAAEEGIDGANWCGFEFVKRSEADDIGDECQDLVFAAAHFAQAFALLDGYVEKRDGNPIHRYSE